MFTINDALVSLKINSWILNGEPTSETEFKQMFQKITGTDENGAAILSSNESLFGVTWTQIQTEIERLETEYVAKEYQRDRATAYPSIAEQLDLLYHDIKSGALDSGNWIAAIEAVKTQYPKP